MTIRAPLLMVVAIAVVSCSSAGTDHKDLSQDSATPTLSDFTNGTWKLYVDREWDGTTGTVAFPTGLLEESWYVPVVSGPVYPIVVYDQGLWIAIGTTPLKGQRFTSSDSEVRYDITEGAFAGGLFVARSSATGLQGELTIYGSGVPIISSERGPLVLEP